MTQPTITPSTGPTESATLSTPSQTNNDILTETVELPSEGLLYPKDNPLSSGKIIMKYMTAKEEDILTNRSYIEKGTVLDKLLQSLIVSKINYDDLIVGDKNAILIAARVLGYGKDYSFTYGGEEHNVDLSILEPKTLNKDLIKPGINEFSFTLPNAQIEITFKILTHGDEKKIQAELDGLKKLNKNESYELSTRLKHMITSVNGNREQKNIRDFIMNRLLARDSRALREYIRQIQPDIDLTFFPDGGEESINIPIGVNFFWPDA